MPRLSGHRTVTPVEPMPELPRVAVIEDDPGLSAQLAGFLDAVPFPSIRELEAAVGPYELVVVVLGPSLASEEALDQVERVTRDHERLTGTPVQASLGPLPAHVPLPIKIALFRALQEALSNATRHGDGADLRARVWSAGESLCMAVSDQGSGFDATGLSAALKLIIA